MEKSVQNTSEGILGAIKTVTHKPVSNNVDVKDRGPLPNVPKLRNLVARTPSSLVREIELSKTGQGKLSAAAAETKEAPVDSTSRKKVEAKSEVHNPAREVRQEKPLGKKEPAAVIEKVPKSQRSVKSRNISDSSKLHSEIREPASRPAEDVQKKVSPRADSVLPNARPASVNRDVDRILDSIDLNSKSHVYLMEKMRGRVSGNLLETELNDMCKPDMSIVGPVFNALQYSFHQPQIVNLYGNLISTAMSKKTARFAHPGFVDLIRNITEDEARVLSWFYKNKILPVIDIKKVLTKTQSEMRLNTLVSSIAQEAGCEFDDLAEGYLANLERIGLLEIPRTTCLTDNKLYKSVLAIPAVSEKLDKLNNGSKDFRGAVVKYYAKLSVYGIKFCHACIR